MTIFHPFSLTHLSRTTLLTAERYARWIFSLTLMLFALFCSPILGAASRDPENSQGEMIQIFSAFNSRQAQASAYDLCYDDKTFSRRSNDSHDYLLTVCIP
jgi:hypothetical protein